MKYSSLTIDIISSSLAGCINRLSWPPRPALTSRRSDSVFETPVVLLEFLCNLVFFFRQCASAALNDVRQYLTQEGGQVAVGQRLNALL